MVTPDKDFAQLVTDNIFIYKPGNRGSGPTIMGKKEVCDKYGLQNIDQFIDFLAMMGDSSDNIPGIAGVGPKTAQKLIEEYGSMKEVYDNIENISGKLKDKLEDSKENAFLSKKLVKIITDAPLDHSISELLRKELNFEKFEKLCQELEFKNIIERVKKSLKIESQNVNEEKSQNKESQLDLFSQPLLDHKINILYKSSTWMANPLEIETFYNHLLLQKKISMEIVFEIGNLDLIQFVLFADYNKNVTIIEANKNNIESIKILINKLFSSKNILKIGFDFKKIISRLSFLNASLSSESFFDIMLAGYLLNPDGNNSLERITPSSI